MKLLFAFCLLIFCVQTSAQNILDYYRAVVPVKSQSAAERKHAAQKGMEEVLVRMSATSEVLKNGRVQAAVDKAQSYLEQYQFRLVKDEALREQGYREEMYLVFSPELIRQLLHKAGVRFWSEGNRPKVLLWLVEDDAQYGKQLLNADSTAADGEVNAVIVALEEAARVRGLPLSYPLLDLEDQMAIGPEDVWRMREDKIREASKRYSASVILVGRYSSTSKGELWSTWQYYHLDFNQNWDTRAAAANQFAMEALAPLNEFLAQRYAVVPGVQDENAALVLRLAGINSFKQFRQALDYLSGMAMIRDVSVIEASDGELLLALRSDANFERFTAAVQLDRKIQLVPQQTHLPEWQQLPQGTRENPAHFEWRGT